MIVFGATPGQLRLFAAVANLVPRFRHTIALCIAASLAIGFALSGSHVSTDEQIRNVRDGFRARTATGSLYVIEIDAKSLASAGAWPWKRSIYVSLIERLGRAGVTTIAFDVDFSSPSNPLEDAALAQALAAFPGTVILPTFRQPEAANSRRFIENLPIPALRANAFLGSVSVLPDHDGYVRTYPFGIVTDNVARPSISALLANHPGSVTDSFRVDPAIDPLTLPRLSFVDIVNGTADMTALRGKSVIIGATAVEMGDRYAMPRNGIIPGVVLQAIATETLIQGTNHSNLGFWPMTILALLIGAAALRYRSFATRLIIIVLGLGVILVFPLFLELASLGSVEIAPAIGLMLIFALLLNGLSIAKKLRKDLLTDRDTELPNERALLRDHRGSGSVIVVAIKLKQYEEVSALLDADQAVRLAKRVTERIALTFGETRVYLLGPGLFSVVTQQISVDATIDQVEGLVAIFRSPIDLGNRSMIVSPVVGIALGDGAKVRETCGYASFAVTRAYEEGHHWTLHNSSATDQADRAQILLADVDKAMADGQIYVVYQPKWHFAEQRICGSEALVRWRHSVFGPIGPDQFIPILENNGYLDLLTFFVLDRSIEQLRRWSRAGLDTGVAVNISAPLFADANFVALLLERVEGCGVLANRLTLEITESATIASPAQTVSALDAVRRCGVRVSIDDYGTGNSTLSYLKTFPADEIKIDQSFVTRMLASPSDQILVRSTIELAHELGFSVVAEGIEDGECLAKLADYGCDTAQGWHIGKPVMADEFFELVRCPAPDERAAAA